MLYQIFYKLPVFLQNVFLSGYGFWNDKRRYGGDYKVFETEVLNRNCSNIDEVKQCQKKMLKRHFINAAKTKYWKDKFNECNVNIAGDPFEELKKLPILSKDEVKIHSEEIKAHHIKERMTKVHTSGSTGSGLIFCETREAEARKWATWWRYRLNHGIKKTMWCGLFGGRSILTSENKKGPFHRINYASRQVLFSAYHLSESTIEQYVNILNLRSLKWLHGYPSFLSELASIALKKGLQLNYQVKFVTIGAENLSLSQSKLIEAFFGVTPLQHYGMAECVANFSQQVGSDYLLVDEDFSFVEFIASGDNYKVIGTNFTNLAFPLFRYDVGDVVSEVDSSHFPRIVHNIDGRCEDIVTLPTGERVGRLDHIFKDAVGVDQAQIVQKCLSKLTVKVIKNNNWQGKMSEDYLRKEFRKRIGNDLDIVFEYPKKIEKTKSGKVRFVISTL